MPRRVALSFARTALHKHAGGGELGNALFIVARVPGLIAQAYEEQQREAPMRQIDATAHVYDGPSERRLPETRV